MGRIPFKSPARLYPPFLAPDLGVDPFKADSVIYYTPVAPRTVQPGQPGTPEEQALVIPPGGLGHVVYGTPILPDPSTLPGYDPAQFISAIGDVPFQGGVHGDIAIRGAHGWILLAAGTAGEILKTNGGGNNPSWEAA